MPLVGNGQVLSSVEVASTHRRRAKGLLERTGFDGAMLLYRTSSVHTLGMRFAIDVAFCKKAEPRDLVVTATTTMKPWRLGYPRFASSVVLEAEAGSFARWGLLPGDRLQVVHQPTATSAARQTTADLHAAPLAAADGSERRIGLDVCTRRSPLVECHPIEADDTSARSGAWQEDRDEPVGCPTFSR